MLLEMFHATLVLLAPVMLLLCGKKNKSEKVMMTKPTHLSAGDEPPPSRAKSVSRSGQSSGRSGVETQPPALQARPSSTMPKSQAEPLPNTPVVDTPAEKPKTAQPATIVGTRRVNSNAPKTTMSQGSRITPSGQGAADDGGYENLPEMTPEEMAAIDRNGFA